MCWTFQICTHNNILSFPNLYTYITFWAFQICTHIPRFEFSKSIHITTFWTFQICTHTHVLLHHVLNPYNAPCSKSVHHSTYIRSLGKQQTYGMAVRNCNCEILLNKVLQEGVCRKYGVYCSTRYCRKECVGGMESIAQQGTAARNFA